MKLFQAISVILLMLVLAFGQKAQATSLTLPGLLKGQVTQITYNEKEIMSYMELTLIDTRLRSQLFNRAQNDYKTYLKLKDEWLQNNIDFGIKRLALFKILEFHAVTQGQGIFQNASERDFKKYFDSHIQKHLKPFLDHGLTKPQALTKLSEVLMENNYPHQEDQNQQEILALWIKTERERVKKLYQEELLRQFALSLSQDKSSITPKQVRIFDKEIRDKIILLEESLKNANALNYQEVLSAEQESFLAIKDLKVFTLIDSSLEEINDSRILSNLHSKISTSWNQEKLDRLIHYQNISEKLREKYQDAEILKKKAFESEENKKNDEQKILSFLYKMAALPYQDLTPLKEEINNLMLEALTQLEALPNQDISQNLLTWASHFLETKKLSENYGQYTQLFWQMTKEALFFDLKKEAFLAPIKYSIKFHSFENPDYQQSLRDYLSSKQSLKQLKVWCHQFADKYQGQISLNGDLTQILPFSLLLMSGI